MRDLVEAITVIQFKLIVDLFPALVKTTPTSSIPYLQPVSRSRCPRECTRTAATQLNVYLGVTDRTAAASVAPVAVDR